MAWHETVCPRPAPPSCDQEIEGIGVGVMDHLLATTGGRIKLIDVGGAGLSQPHENDQRLQTAMCLSNTGSGYCELVCRCAPKPPHGALRVGGLNKTPNIPSGGGQECTFLEGIVSRNAL